VASTFVNLGEVFQEPDRNSEAILRARSMELVKAGEIGFRM
jgi:hypothetical protein